MGYKVSIVIPVYNGANYMRAAINSALAQTYKNIEIIVVNDGSNDGGETREIALSYGDKIRYFEKENGGVSSALNLALEKMTGDYFSWLSHDDVYYPEKIERQIEKIKKCNKRTILYSNYDLINSDGEKFDTIFLNHELLTSKPDYAVFRGAIGGITLLIPKEAFEEYGGFDEEYRCVQDYLKWFQFLDKYTFVHMDEVLAASRVHEGQVTFTSPKMISEGNYLWTLMARDYPKEKKIKCEGSEYLFYYKLKNHLINEPYEEAIENISEMADKCYDEAMYLVKRSNCTVIIIDNGDLSDIERTVASLNRQTFKDFSILIEGSTKCGNYINSRNRADSIKYANSDYYTFLHAGYEVSEKWLEDQLTIALLTDKALVISDYPNINNRNLVDNYASLLTSIDGVLINSKYKIKYVNDYQFLYDIAVKGGSIIIDAHYLLNRKLKYDMKDVYKYLENVLKDGYCSNFDIATLNYDISCIFNKYGNNQNKVYMYEPCNEYRELMYSRSFRILKNYIDKKKRKRKKI